MKSVDIVGMRLFFLRARYNIAKAVVRYLQPRLKKWQDEIVDITIDAAISKCK